MITLLARFEMQPGKELAALDALRKMSDAVKEGEPGCLLYSVTRGQVNAQELYVYEVYADQMSLDSHRKTDHMRDLQAAFEECLNRSSFNVELLLSVAGFARDGAIQPPQ